MLKVHALGLSGVGQILISGIEKLGCTACDQCLKQRECHHSCSFTTFLPQTDFFFSKPMQENGCSKRIQNLDNLDNPPLIFPSGCPQSFKAWQTDRRSSFIVTGLSISLWTGSSVCNRKPGKADTVKGRWKRAYLRALEGPPDERKRSVHNNMTLQVQGRGSYYSLVGEESHMPANLPTKG